MKALNTLFSLIIVMAALVPTALAQHTGAPKQMDNPYSPIRWANPINDPMMGDRISQSDAGAAFSELGNDATAGFAELTVIHAIPGLPAAVDVYADGGYLFSFDYYQSVGPLSLPAASYYIEVKLQGNTVLFGTADLEADRNYSAIAHLVPGEPDAGIKLSFFENDIGSLDAGSTRVTLRHTADAPAVDIGLNYSYAPFYPQLFPYVKARGLSNGDAPGQFGAVDLPFGFYSGIFFAAGTSMDVYDTGAALLLPDTAYIVYAIGSFGGGTFTLFIQAIDL